MPESIPSSTERTVVVQRHGALTYISLAFNALILLLILIAIVSHHDRPPQPPQDHGGDRRGEAFDRGGHWGDRDFGGMRQEWKHRRLADREEDRRMADGSPAMCDQDESGGGSGMRHGEGMRRDWHGPGEFSGDQQPPNAEAMTDRFMLALTSRLALTDQESAQIRPVVQQNIAQFQKDMEAQKAAHQKMLDDAKAKIHAVLTPDQQKEFDAMTAEMGGPPEPGK